MKIKALVNARLILKDHLATGQALLFDEQIEGLIPVSELPKNIEKIDAGGHYVSPGFINIHIHGCGGADTMDATPEALDTISTIQAATGVTAFLPTTMTYDLTSIDKALTNIRKVMDRGEEPGAKILGAYLEGPFINAEHKGAQKATYIQKADFCKLHDYTDLIRYILLAPETLNDEELQEFIQLAQQHGIQLTLGHSGATYEQAYTFLRRAGCKHVTHLFNGMTPFHHRRPGIVGAAWNTDAMCELICDNVHSHPAAQCLTYRLKGLDHLILITDSMRACALGDGVSELGGQKVFVDGTRATLTDGTIAGSVLTMDRALAIFKENAGLTFPEVIQLVTLNPARELHDPKRGRLSYGCRADLTIFDETFKIQATYVGGKLIYQRD